MITIVLMLLLLPTPYENSHYYWGLFVFYAAAKVVEFLDHEILQLTPGCGERSQSQAAVRGGRGRMHPANALAAVPSIDLITCSAALRYSGTTEKQA
jgi:hypothetical protein